LNWLNFTRKGAKKAASVGSARKAKEYKQKLRKNCLKRTKPKKNNVRIVKSELRNWTRK